MSRGMTVRWMCGWPACLCDVADHPQRGSIMFCSRRTERSHAIFRWRRVKLHTTTNILPTPLSCMFPEASRYPRWCPYIGNEWAELGHTYASHSFARYWPNVAEVRSVNMLTASARSMTASAQGIVGQYTVLITTTLPGELCLNNTWTPTTFNTGECYKTLFIGTFVGCGDC